MPTILLTLSCVDRVALLRRLHYHLENRVFVHRGRTVVFRD